MELQFPDIANLRSSSSSFLPTFAAPSTAPIKRSTKRTHSPFFYSKSPKRNSGTSRALQKHSKRDLSRILRTESAVKAIERKSNSDKYTQLWPKAVLEALEDAIKSNQWESALKVFELLRKQHWYQPRCQTYTKLFMMLGKCRQPGQVSLLFEKMRVEGLAPTVDVYTSLVSAYGLSGRLDQAFRAINEMKSVTDCKPDVYTYTVLINCCAKLRRFDLIDRILDEMSYMGIGCSTVTYNTILDGYGKAEMFEQMESMLTDMVETGRCLPDGFTLNSFIWAYGNAGKIDEMESWYDEFQLMGIKPDMKTFNILIRSYGKVAMYDKIELVMDFMVKRFFSPTTVTFNILIEIFGRAGHIDKMDYYFRAMKYRGIKPNSVTYCSLVTWYSKNGQLQKVGSILRQVENTDADLDTPFFNCVISAYGRAGDLATMEEIFMEMKQKKCKPDNITYATMVQAYNAKGMVKEAYELEINILDKKENPGTLYDSKQVVGGESDIKYRSMLE